MNYLKENFNFPLCLAPMVGLTHVALRMAIRDYLPKNARTIWPTEMLNSRRLPNEKVGFTPETFKHIDEEGLVPQILGNEENFIADSIAVLEKWGAIGIDINMGCPVQKALKHNYGVALMGDADYAAKVVGMAVRNSRVPVSVKLRAGHQNDFSYLKDFVQGLESSGASWVTLHPRTAAQQRRGSADWSQITRLKLAIKIPVIGNGDIQISKDVHEMLRETACDFVMAGRALAARPWMLWQLGEELGFESPLGREGQEAPRGALQEGAEYGIYLLKLLAWMKHYFTEDLAIRKFRFFIRTTAVWLQFGNALYGASMKAKNLEEMEQEMKNFFSYPQEMLSKTELRQ